VPGSFFIPINWKKITVFGKETVKIFLFWWYRGSAEVTGAAHPARGRGARAMEATAVATCPKCGGAIHADGGEIIVAEVREEEEEYDQVSPTGTCQSCGQHYVAHPEVSWMDPLTFDPANAEYTRKPSQ
jgi:hypothetical protein